jgi:hypothetical protein
MGTALEVSQISQSTPRNLPGAEYGIIAQIKIEGKDSSPVHNENKLFIEQHLQQA